MTKPFQSIRQLFGRMLGGNPAGEDRTAHEYSTLGIGSPEPQPSTNDAEGQSDGLAGENSQTDFEAQTADTRRLPQVAPEFLSRRNGGASQPRVAHDEDTDEFGDVLLDLGDIRGGKAFAGDDPLLDILDETAAHDDFFVEATPEAPAPAEDATSATAAFAEDSSEAAAPVPVFEESREWAIATETVAVEVAQTESEAEESGPASSASPTNRSDLSPEAIDAIAQRVVAQLSDKVVREIAWEVVPELAELLIKQKLKEQK
ncbi:MAG TPA: hypothetical protein VHE60_19215 [Pyrinomonadaceae bacterium]|nr:hypothetical protein [Pyrinomonadaceae bacterium]